MQITITNETSGQVYGPLDISDDMSLQDLIALLELDCSFDREKHDIYHNMNPLDSKSEKNMKELEIGNDSLLLIRLKSSNTVGSSSASNTTSTGYTNDYTRRVDQMNDDQFIEEFRQELLHNDELRRRIGFEIPNLEQLVRNKDEFHSTVGPTLIQRRHGGYPGSVGNNPLGISQQEYVKIMSNPDDPTNQQRIAELINQQEIDEQMRNALEYTPESFARVNMLYINMEINGYPVKAFVDSGAQSTIMSPQVAEKTGLSRLIDKRFKGEARGVGVGKILGKIHQAQVKIETQFIPCSFVVLETDIDILLGLDMLRRHQAKIDLGKDSLFIAGVETKFLGEADIPKNIFSEENLINEEEKRGIASSSGVKLGSGQPSSKYASTSIKTTPTAQPKKKEYTEATIKQLMDLGFSKMEVIRALDMANGNAEVAASLLFSI